MTRKLTFATALAAVIVLPAIAEDAKTGTEPGAGATSTMSDPAALPQIKSDAEAIGNATSENQAKPSAEMPTISEQKSTGIALSEKEAQSWVAKPVYSSDGEQVGEVMDFQRDAANKVIGMQADIGGFLGFGETRVNVSPAQFNLQGDRVMLNLTAEQAKALPNVQI